MPRNACRVHRAVIRVAALAVAACVRAAAADHAGGLQDASAALGEACSFFEDCAGVAACIGGACRAQLALGDVCDTGVVRRDGEERDYNCVTPLICVRGLCAVAGAIGDACDSYRDCKGASPCVLGACARYKTIGDDCDSSDDCQGVYCSDGTCRRLGEIGDGCDFTDALCGRRMRCMTGVCEKVFDTHAQIRAADEKEAAFEATKLEDKLQAASSPSPLPIAESTKRARHPTTTQEPVALPSTPLPAFPSSPPQASATLPPSPGTSASSPSPIPAQRGQLSDETASVDEGDGGGVSNSVIGASVGGVFGLVSVLIAWLLNKHCRNKSHPDPVSEQKLDDVLLA